MFTYKSLRSLVFPCPSFSPYIFKNHNFKKLAQVQDDSLCEERNKLVTSQGSTSGMGV